MTEPLSDPLANHDFPITCQMQHPTKNNTDAEPCTRQAHWIGTVHDCTKKRDYPNNGTTIPICAWYIDDLRTRTYPYRCPGCAQDFTSILMLIWDIQNLNPTKK